MLVPELKSSQRHPPSPKELGETEVNRESRMLNSKPFLDCIDLEEIRKMKFRMLNFQKEFSDNMYKTTRRFVQ